MDLAGKTCVITGIGAGIGAATAEVFAGYGAQVIGLEKTQAALDRTVDRIAESGRSLHAICTDVSLEASVRAAFEEIRKRLSLRSQSGSLAHQSAAFESNRTTARKSTVRLGFSKEPPQRDQGCHG